MIPWVTRCRHGRWPAVSARNSSHRSAAAGDQASCPPRISRRRRHGCRYKTERMGLRRAWHARGLQPRQRRHSGRTYHGMARAAGPPHSVTELNRRQAPPCMYWTPLLMEHRPADARHRLGDWSYAFLMPANRYTKKTGGRNWVRTSDPSLVRRAHSVAGRRLPSPVVPASWSYCRQASPCVARCLPALAPRLAPRNSVSSAKKLSHDLVKESGLARRRNQSAFRQADQKTDQRNQ
jgi:hypothetical protein